MIKIYKTKTYNGKTVCESTLRLFQATTREVETFGAIRTLDNGWVKPILVSGTEQLEVGVPLMIHPIGVVTTPKDIDDVHGYNNFLEDGQVALKVLGQIQNLTEEQREMIANGILKDGDEVLLECETPSFQLLKIDNNNHIKHV